jgi:hypothetical protein
MPLGRKRDLTRVSVPNASINTLKNPSAREIFDLHLVDSLYTPVYEEAIKAKEGGGSHGGKNDFWAFAQRINGRGRSQIGIGSKSRSRKRSRHYDCLID